ncbi:nucleoside hydrolase, partial [Roseomonas sp. 18066]|uniref:nucleoside hydrolase n=1 Tax=Roseomonas sp. 18066 TaxID=2681412 RepID=UPI00135ACDFC
ADRPLVGRFRSETDVHGADGLGGVVLPPGPAATPGLAVDAIRAALRDAEPGSVTLVGIGPATNFALALSAEPALLDRVAEIVLMTGALSEGNWTQAAEFNAAMDPEALAILLSCGRPVVLATLDLTAQAFVTPARIEALRAVSGGACLRAAVEVLAAVPPSRRFGYRGVALHDPCAVAWLVAPSLFTTREVAAAVVLDGVDRGRTRIDRWGRDKVSPRNAVFLEKLDADGFFALLSERLSSLH